MGKLKLPLWALALATCLLCGACKSLEKCDCPGKNSQSLLF